MDGKLWQTHEFLTVGFIEKPLLFVRMAVCLKLSTREVSEMKPELFLINAFY